MKTRSPALVPLNRLPLALIFGGLLVAAQPTRAAIGYVNVGITNGYQFLVNPLQAVTHSINTVLTNATPPDGTKVWLWDVTNQVFEPPAIYQAGVGWSINLSLPPGRGFILYAPSSYNCIFLGEVLQGMLTNFIAGDNRLTLTGSKVPVGGPLATAIAFPGTDGDLVSVYPTLNQSYLDGYTYLTNHGWFDPKGIVSTNGPMIPVAGAFFVRHRGPDTNWVRNFVIAASLTGAGGSGPPPPDIVGLTIQNGLATLQLSETNRSFNVQFSPDHTFWTTIATNQTGGTWTGPCPSPTAGYFQLVSP